MSVKIPLNELSPIFSLERAREHKFDRNDSMRLPNEDRLKKFHKPEFKVVDDYQLSPMPVFPPPYIQFKPQSNANLFDTIDYDMDEEDMAWLEAMNVSRQRTGLQPVSEDDFELLLDRFEKESFLHMEATHQTEVAGADDVVCCVCLEEDSEDANLILFCDSCNLSVHQACYGVPYVPEGQWFCRKCSHSPIEDVNCVLYPNTCGAFKQTDMGHWAHVSCALWVPEVSFGNVQLMEPIEGVENIPAARLKSQCNLCNRKNIGATVRCQQQNCKLSFHVTCAQLKGSHLKLVLDGAIAKPEALCLNHSPMDAPKRKMFTNSQRNVNIPSFPIEKIQDIGRLVTFECKGRFVLRLIAYWKLKRLLRNCVPLLNRLEIPDYAGYEKFKKVLTELHESHYFNSSLKLLEKYFSWERQRISMHKYSCVALTKFDEFFTKHADHLELSTGNFDCVVNIINKFMEFAKRISNLKIRAQRIQIVDILIKKVHKSKSVTLPKSPINLTEDSEIEDDHRLSTSLKCNSLLQETKSRNYVTPVGDALHYSHLKNPSIICHTSSLNNTGQTSALPEPSQENYIITNDSDSPEAARESPTPLPDPPCGTRNQLPESHSVRLAVEPETNNFSVSLPAPENMEGVEEMATGSEITGQSQQHAPSEETLLGNDNDNGEDVPNQGNEFNAFEIVWAKCQGHPWYPAMIINPAMRDVSPINGLSLHPSIPEPPPDVVALASKQSGPRHLVCYYDLRRSWEWLPVSKVRRFGHEEIDKTMLKCSSQRMKRREVRKAYHRALKHLNLNS